MRALNVDTGLGSFTIALFDHRAPITCHYFRELAARGTLDNGRIFRITSDRNHTDTDRPCIHIVQCGTGNGLAERRVVIGHEPTTVTGLTHRRWTVSASRFAPGEVYDSFFICMRNEPALDFGGGRRDDGHGYAAFGEVVAGHDTLTRAYAAAESAEILQTPIAIDKVSVIRRQPST